jgi:hypothetical protein
VGRYQKTAVHDTHGATNGCGSRGRVEIIAGLDIGMSRGLDREASGLSIKLLRHYDDYDLSPSNQ